MRSLQLEATLTTFVESAAAHLQNQILAGAEVPFDLEQGARTGPTGPSLYSYRPLTATFIRERTPELTALATFGPARDALATFDGLPGYLAACGEGTAAPGGSPGAALIALLCDIFDEQSDFQLYSDRLERALAALERAAAAGAGDLTVVVTLHGMAIAGGELALAPGLRIARPEALDGLPAAVRGAGEEPHLVVMLSTDGDVERARTLLRELLRALRLFGDGRVALGELGWFRHAAGAWLPLVVGTGGRPHGMLVVAADQEDELRAFCALARAPHAAGRTQCLGAAALRTGLRPGARRRSAFGPPACAASPAGARGIDERPAGAAAGRAVRRPR